MATAWRVAGRSVRVASSKESHLLIFSRNFQRSLAVDTAAPAPAVTTKPSHHNDHKHNHVYLAPTDFIGSWKPARDPKSAMRNLAMLRRDYAKQVKELRKQYIFEVELQRQERQRKDEVRREEIRLKREERKKEKAAAAEARAAERKAYEEEFRRTLLKEREEKLAYWNKRQSKIEEKKKEKKDLVRQQSSMWIEEEKLEGKILEAIVNAKRTPF